MKQLSLLWKKYSFLLLFAFIIFSLFDLRFAIAAVLCMAAPVVISLFRGRYWCGNLCPRGSFYDSIMSKFSRHRRVPPFLKSTYFRGFMILFIMTMFTAGVIMNWGNPYGIGMVFYRIIVVTTIVGIILAVFYNHRTWCHFCPMGTLAAIIAHHRKHKKVLQVSSACVSCNICSRKCPFQINPKDYRNGSLNHPDCIQCGKCLEACPKEAIGYTKLL